MGDMGDMYRDMHDWTKRMKRDRGAKFLQALKRRGLRYRSLNNGVHLKVETSFGEVDLWPTTGKWKHKSGKIYHGLEEFLDYVQQSAETEKESE